MKKKTSELFCVESGFFGEKGEKGNMGDIGFPGRNGERGTPGVQIFELDT